MKEHEAIKKLSELDDYGLVNYEKAKSIIKEIFNELNSKTCENCKHRYIANDTQCFYECFNENSPVYYTNEDIPKDFSCNKWEQKQ